MGAEKLQPFLADWYEPRHLPTPSVRTVMRLWSSRRSGRPGSRLNPHRAAYERKPNGFKEDYPGHYVGEDTIELQRGGLEYYIGTFTDLRSRFALVAASASKSGMRASVLWWLSKACFLYPIEQVLSDNGSEFEAASDAKLAKDGAGR